MHLFERDCTIKETIGIIAEYKQFKKEKALWQEDFETIETIKILRPK
jgi:hypothetical protein